jgi:hypothetical protein
MSRCPACRAFDAAERAALEGSETLPEHSLQGCTCASEPAVAMTLLGPERIALRPPRGIRLEVTSHELVRWVEHPIVTADPASAGAFVLASLRDGIRSSDHVESVSALALEHDAGTMTPQTAHERLQRYRHIVYSTASSRPDAPCWRALLIVSRAMTPEEHGLVWNRCARVVAHDAKVDAATKDPCRLWSVPTLPPGATHVVLVGEGSPLDVDRILAIAGARRMNPPAPLGAPPSGYQDMDVALECHCDRVARASKEMRNVALHRACDSLARLPISSAEFAGALLRAAVRAGLPERQARKTITRALSARRGRA